MNIKNWAAFAAAVISLSACRENSDLKTTMPLPELSDPATIAEAKGKTAWFPPGTSFTMQQGHLHAVPPATWRYLGTGTDGRTFDFSGDAAAGDITCTCNSGGTQKCRPFKASSPWGTIVGCWGDCSNCTMTQTKSPEVPPLASGGYYNPSMAPRLLKNGEHAPAVFDELTELPTFGMMLKVFMEAAYRGKPFADPVFNSDGTATAPEGHSLAAVSIMGRAMVLVLPESYVQASLGYSVNAKASCKCSNDSGGCTLKKINVMGMSTTWCDGTCNGCTLSTGDKLYEVELHDVPE